MRLKLWLAFCAWAALPLAASAAPLGEASFSNDADGFTAGRLGLGGTFRYKSPADYSGLLGAYTRFSQGGWAMNETRALFVHQGQTASGRQSLQAALGAGAIDDHTQLVGDAVYYARVAKATGLELIGAREWVETQPALEAGLVSTFAGASIDQGIGSRWTAVALLGRQYFSDGNDRTHLRGRLIAGLSSRLGLTLQLRHRRYEASDPNVPRRYFNPEDYEETQLALAMRRRFARPWQPFLVTGSAGFGQERVNRDERNSTMLFELGAEGLARDRAWWRVVALHQRASGFESGPEYWYTRLGVSLNIPFH